MIKVEQQDSMEGDEEKKEENRSNPGSIDTSQWNSEHAAWTV